MPNQVISWRVAISVMFIMIGGGMILGAGFTQLAYYLAAWIYPIGPLEEFISDPALQGKYPYALLLLQTFASIGAFLLPSVFTLLLVFPPKENKLGFDQPRDPSLLILSISIMAVSIPLISWLQEINMRIPLPDSLNWVKTSDLELNEGYGVLLQIDSGLRLIITLLVVAVLPALAEEIMFRGVIQSLFEKWILRPHLSVWITALLFSVIHMHFEGLLPRLALGGLLGYLMLYSGNIIYPIIAHFTNNAIIVIFAYIAHKSGLDIRSLEENEPNHWLAFFTTFIIVGFMLMYIKRCKQLNSLKKHGE